MWIILWCWGSKCEGSDLLLVGNHRWRHTQQCVKYKNMHLIYHFLHSSIDAHSVHQPNTHKIKYTQQKLNKCFHEHSITHHLWILDRCPSDRRRSWPRWRWSPRVWSRTESSTCPARRMCAKKREERWEMRRYNKSVHCNANTQVAVIKPTKTHSTPPSAPLSRRPMNTTWACRHSREAAADLQKWPCPPTRCRQLTSSTHREPYLRIDKKQSV